MVVVVEGGKAVVVEVDRLAAVEVVVEDKLVVEVDCRFEVDGTLFG